MTCTREKADKLAHYAMREAKAFIQIDGFKDGDDVMGPDQDGQCILGGSTVELMQGADVRVLIPHNGQATTAETVLMLRKITDWIEAQGLENFKHSRGGTESEVPF